MSESLWFFYQISISNYMTAFCCISIFILLSLQKFFTSQTFFNIGFSVKYLNARSCLHLSFLNCLLDFCFIVVACHSPPLLIHDWRSIPPPHKLQNFGTPRIFGILEHRDQYRVWCRTAEANVASLIHHPWRGLVFTVFLLHLIKP